MSAAAPVRCENRVNLVVPVPTEKSQVENLTFLVKYLIDLRKGVKREDPLPSIPELGKGPTLVAPGNRSAHGEMWKKYLGSIGYAVRKENPSLIGHDNLLASLDKSPNPPPWFKNAIVNQQIQFRDAIKKWNPSVEDMPSEAPFDLEATLAKANGYLSELIMSLQSIHTHVCVAEKHEGPGPNIGLSQAEGVLFKVKQTKDKAISEAGLIEKAGEKKEALEIKRQVEALVFACEGAVEFARKCG
ncbi:MAG: hypothetical protein P0S96_05925 [Simkaniaceae bacterium]|nr:hypothetical protein [Candidatus Sacchlamyda saccharinae]